MVLSVVGERPHIGLRTAVQSSVALLQDGSVKAWGRSSYGQLGLGDTNDRATPIEVTALGSNVMDIEHGYFHVVWPLCEMAP